MTEEVRMSNEHPAAAYIDRIVSLEEEVRSLRHDIRDIYKEAKEAGHLSGAVRIVVKRKLEDDDQRASREALETEADQIMAALGMLADLPLGQAAAEAPRRRRKRGNSAAEEPAAE